jgi:uncharacterized protein
MAGLETVAKIVRLNGGKLVGKTRLQKSAYFLEALGKGFDLDFEYHHYGPYSEELAALADDAKALGLVDIQPGHTADGSEYAIFLATKYPIEPEPQLDQHRRAILRVLSEYTSTELELAATADFLAKYGYGRGAWDETQRRKASKVSPDRVARAKRLLEQLAECQ